MRRALHVVCNLAAVEQPVFAALVPLCSVCVALQIAMLLSPFMAKLSGNSKADMITIRVMHPVSRDQSCLSGPAGRCDPLVLAPPAD